MKYELSENIMSLSKDLKKYNCEVIIQSIALNEEFSSLFEKCNVGTLPNSATCVEIHRIHNKGNKSWECGKLFFHTKKENRNEMFDYIDNSFNLIEEYLIQYIEQYAKKEN